MGKKRKEPFGRPTKYRPEFCQDLIDHMSKGYSYETFGAALYDKYGKEFGVHKDTLYEWEKEHSDFSDAKKVAFMKCQQEWEELGIKGTQGSFIAFSGSTWIFNMKNRFKWRDRSDIELNGALEVTKGNDIQKLFKDPDTAAQIHQIALKLSQTDEPSET